MLNDSALWGAPEMYVLFVNYMCICGAVQTFLSAAVGARQVPYVI